jgi:hypothetical protein
MHANADVAGPQTTRARLRREAVPHLGFDPLHSDPRWEKVLERLGLR